MDRRDKEKMILSKQRYINKPDHMVGMIIDRRAHTVMKANLICDKQTRSGEQYSLGTHSNSLIMNQMCSFDRKNGKFIMVAHDKLGLYPRIIDNIGMRIVKNYYRKVKHRSCQRVGSFNENVFVCKVDTSG